MLRALCLAMAALVLPVESSFAERENRFRRERRAQVLASVCHTAQVRGRREQETRGGLDHTP